MKHQRYNEETNDYEVCGEIDIQSAQCQTCGAYFTNSVAMVLLEEFEQRRTELNYFNHHCKTYKIEILSRNVEYRDESIHRVHDCTVTIDGEFLYHTERIIRLQFTDLSTEKVIKKCRAWIRKVNREKDLR